MKQTTWFKIARFHITVTRLSVPLAFIIGIALVLAGHSDNAEGIAQTVLLFGLVNAPLGFIALERSI